MTEEDLKRRKFENGVPFWFVLMCLLNYNFKSFRRFLIYLLNAGSLIDLRERSSAQMTNEEIVVYFEPMLGSRVPRPLIRDIIGVQSRTTFNKYFGDFIKENNLSKRNGFTLLEAYKLLEFWQGEGKWGRFKAAKKQKLANILHNKNYERTAEEFRGAVDLDEYKPNLLSPKTIKNFIRHVDLTDDDKVEALIGYGEFKKSSLWAFGILMFYHSLNEKGIRMYNPRDVREPMIFQKNKQSGPMEWSEALAEILGHTEK
ncbi:hypothetical protein [Nonlabens agnitus]|uniref:Uncharacterized protein n=1 Tax=Nonlabens agnitus TaxID=870484 RepID=A0A2S9WS24_9FLAO|nr:hypothetical protein [Nonlabens agnitus]PRP66265.1 hypothetical protein BST86_03745 [Nonlabens agnitus]